MQHDEDPRPVELPASAARSRRWQRPAMAILAVGALAWLWAVDPARSVIAPRCLFHDLTGLHCPGCGSTRAAHALLHGRVGEALAFNLVFTLGLPLAALALGWRRWRKGRWSLPAVSGPAVLAGLLLFGVLRNVPGPTSSPLAPPGEATIKAARDAAPPDAVPAAGGRHEPVADRSDDYPL